MWPFKTAKKIAHEHKNVQASGGSAYIDSIDLIGRYVVSADGQYMLVYGTASDCQLDGKFALVKGDNVIFTAKCKRPAIAAVANDGTCVVIDLEKINNHADKISIYTATGSTIMTHVFSAFVACVGVSDEGTHVAVQLHNSKTSDAHKVYVFDVNKVAIVSSFTPQMEVAEKFAFSVEDESVYFCYKNNRKYGYSFFGDFLDSDRYERERVVDASATELVLIVRERLKSVATSQLPKLLTIIDKALKGDLSHFNYRALAYRAKGEIHDAMGETEQAIVAYKKALKLDPKIGVKQKLRKLAK